MSVTGIAMFFDWEPGLTTVVHQWMSWIFLFAVIVHVAVNFRPFKLHLKALWGQGSITLFSLILIMSFFTWGQITGPQMKDKIELLLVDASLSALAELSNESSADLIRRFQNNGLDASAEISIRDLVQTYNVDENYLLAIVFMPERFAE